MIENVHDHLLTECTTCKALVNAEVLYDYKCQAALWWGDELYSFAKCPKCNMPLLLVQEENSGGALGEAKRVYPSQDKRINPHLPDPIKMSFLEARNCFKVKSYTATVLMCRKTLEGICNAHGIKARNLADGLLKMKEQGIIEKNLFEWAEALRMFGNEAAHDVNVVFSLQDTKDILDFTDAIIEYVFTFKDKFNEFLARREKKKKNSD